MGTIMKVFCLDFFLYLFVSFCFVFTVTSVQCLCQRLFFFNNTPYFNITVADRLKKMA